jgi:hypothetical protein
MVSEYRLVDGTNPRLRFSHQQMNEEEMMKMTIKEEPDLMVGFCFWGDFEDA